MKAILIAGGKGSRVSDYTKEIPKPMIPINGKPILEYQIEELKSYGWNDIVITVGYKKELIQEYFGSGENFGVRITYIEEAEPLGSAGALYHLKKYAEETFFVAYGDVMFSLDINKLLEAHTNGGALITLVAHPNSHPEDSDLIQCNEQQRVIGVIKKGMLRTEYYHNLVNAGIFIVEGCCLSYFAKQGKYDFETDFLSHYIELEKVKAYRTCEYMKDMGTYMRLSEVMQNVKDGIPKKRNLSQPQKCVFIDRDGTINQKNDFIYHQDMLELEPCAAQAIKLLNENGYLAIVVTNQPVIARGMCSLKELDTIHAKMETLLGEKGAYVDDIFYCPHHPDRGYSGERKEYKIVCKCRKPEIGLLKKAAEKYNIDFAQSYMIGDSRRDIKTGKNAGIKTIMVLTGDAGIPAKYDAEPDLVSQNLYEAVKQIISYEL